MATEKLRNSTADFIKGILILCVLYGHSVTMVNSLRQVAWVDSPVNVFVTAFEMPLFILISGYFLAYSLKKKEYGKVMWKRIVSIALPLMVWAGIPATVRFILVTVKGGFSVTNLMKIPYACVFPDKLWFLAAYLICSILVIGVEWLAECSKKKSVQIAVRGVLYTGLLVILQFIPYSISSAQFMFVFFLLGFLLSKYEWLKNKGVCIAVYILAGLFVLLYPFYKPEYSFYLLPYIQNIRRDVPIFVYRIVLSICGCCVIYGISRLVCRIAPDRKPVTVIARLGQKTMELYILSMYIQELLRMLLRVILTDTTLINNWTASLLFGPAFLAVLMLSCLVLCRIIKKIPVIQKILFGR